jgi:hypothetical protein
MPLCPSSVPAAPQRPDHAGKRKSAAPPTIADLLVLAVPSGSGKPDLNADFRIAGGPGDGVHGAACRDDHWLGSRRGGPTPS